MRLKILKFFIGSVGTQGLSALSGLLLARWMEVGDYAILTVMTVMTGAMAVMTKGGIHLGFTAILGRTWPNRKRAAQALLAATTERRILSIVVLPPILVITSWILFKNNASWMVILSLLILLIIQWESDMRSRVIDQVLVFANRSPILQGLEAALALLRLCGVTVLHSVSLLNSIGAVAINAIGSGFRVPFVAKWVGQELKNEPCEINADDRKEIKEITKRQLPLDLFYVLQSQIILLILAFNSAPEQTAALGALGRIPQLLLPFQSLFYAFAIPRFSSLSSNLVKTWIYWSSLGMIPGLLLILVAYFFPELLLWLVGPKYLSFQHELLVCVVGVGANMGIGMAWQLLAHRGWNRWAWIQIPIILLWCIISPNFLNLKKLIDVLWFQAGFSLGLFGACIIEIISVSIFKKNLF